MQSDDAYAHLDSSSYFQSFKSVKYAPDLYKVGKKWYPYVNSCIHLDCEAGIGYNKDYGIWQCCDDMNWQYC